jgi:drug/metabolite transporter (DMT)-like permease
MQAGAPSRPVVVGSIALLCLVWGSTWYVIQVGLRDLPPFQSGAARFVIAASAISALVFATRGTGHVRPPRWLPAAVGTCNFGLSYGIVYWSETRLPSGLTSVLWAVFPLLMAACGHWFLEGERLRPLQAAGFVLGFLGVVVLFATDLREQGARATGAALVLLASPVVSAVGTTLLKRHGARASSLLVNRDAMWVGAVLLLAAALLFERDAPARWTPAAIGSVLYLALAGTALTFGLYFWLLRHTAASRLSLIAYATPAIALAVGNLAGGEPIRATTLAGSALILCGVACVVRRAPRPAVEAAADG